MNSIWNNNIKLFCSRFPFLSDIYKKEIDAISAKFSSSDNLEEQLKSIFPFLNIYKAKDSNYSADEVINYEEAAEAQIKIRLHSAYNPKNEAVQSTKNDKIGEKSNIIFYGFGLGYQAVEFAQSFTEKKIILIEPDIFHFFASISLLPWEKIFQHKDLILALACPPDSILQLIENQNKVNVGDEGVSDSYFFDNLNFQKHNIEYFNTVKTIIKRNIKKNDINAATLKKFGRLWCKNSIRNLEEMEKRDFVSTYENSPIIKENDIPFLVLGAGPSLQNVIPHLEQLKKRMVVICVETAYPILQKVGFEPDFIILTDPQFWANNHINGLKAESSVLITEISVYPYVFNFDCKKIVLSSSNFPVGQYFENKLKERFSGFSMGSLGTGGSVASSAWNFAYFAGCRKIYTAGLDLSFPQKLTHIKGSRNEQNFHTSSTKLASVDKMNSSILFSANTELAEDYDGNKVLTDTRMKMFAWWFESRIATCTDSSTFTLCPQSMKINGIQKATVDELLQQKEVIQQKEQFLQTCNSINKESLNSYFSELVESFAKDKSEFLESYPFLKDYIP